jgi:hypothetical protein
MLSINMKDVRPLTKEEIADRVAFTKRLTASFRKLQKEYPLPDDFLDYCKGRKVIAPEEP